MQDDQVSGSSNLCDKVEYFHHKIAAHFFFKHTARNVKENNYTGNLNSSRVLRRKEKMTHTSCDLSSLTQLYRRQ